MALLSAISAGTHTTTTSPKRKVKDRHTPESPMAEFLTAEPDETRRMRHYSFPWEDDKPPELVHIPGSRIFGLFYHGAASETSEGAPSK